jgi:hypothetical protein
MRLGAPSMTVHQIADLTTIGIFGVILWAMCLADPPIAGFWVLVSLAYSKFKT